MDNIYDSASYVLIWLGPEHPLRDDFQWACTTLKIRCEEIAKIPSFVAQLDDTKFWTAADYPDTARRFKNAVLLSAICRWFSRIRAVQEAVLAKQITVLCGSTRLPWHGIAWLGLHFWTSNPLQESAILPRGLELSPSVGRRAWQMERQRWAVSSPKPYVLFASTGIGRANFSLLEIMQIFRGSECFDKGDKIYAMLGIARRKLYVESETLPEIVPVDYTGHTWEDVYGQLAALAIEHLNSLVILSYVALDHAIDPYTCSIPSWFRISLVPYTTLHSTIANGREIRCASGQSHGLALRNLLFREKSCSSKASSSTKC